MKDWEISVWGVRGSAPVPSKEFMEYGGNTSCFSVKKENALEGRLFQGFSFLMDLSCIDCFHYSTYNFYLQYSF